MLPVGFVVATLWAEMNGTRVARPGRVVGSVGCSVSAVRCGSLLHHLLSLLDLLIKQKSVPCVSPSAGGFGFFCGWGLVLVVGWLRLRFLIRMWCVVWRVCSCACLCVFRVGCECLKDTWSASELGAHCTSYGVCMFVCRSVLASIVVCGVAIEQSIMVVMLVWILAWLWPRNYCGFFKSIAVGRTEVDRASSVGRGDFFFRIVFFWLLFVLFLLAIIFSLLSIGINIYINISQSVINFVWGQVSNNYLQTSCVVVGFFGGDRGLKGSWVRFKG